MVFVRRCPSESDGAMGGFRAFFVRFELLVSARDACVKVGSGLTTASGITLGSGGAVRGAG